MAIKKKRSVVHKYTVTITPDEDMGLDDVHVVRQFIEEAIRGTGMDNGASVKVEVTP